jgi:hypothetical protein
MRAKLHKSEVMMVDRSAIKQKRLVYLLIASKRIKYLFAKSGIVYIGSTAKGIRRVAASAAYNAKWILEAYGTRKFAARVVTCPGVPGLPIWKVLESDLLLTFHAQFGELPALNKLRPKSLSGRFPAAQLMGILTELSRATARRGP